MTDRKGRQDTQHPVCPFFVPYFFALRATKNPRTIKYTQRQRKPVRSEKNGQKRHKNGQGRDWGGGKIKKICLGGVEKNKKNQRWGGVEKIKNLLGGSLPCAVPGKGEGVYAARLPFVNVTNVTHGNESIYYILY